MHLYWVPEVTYYLRAPRALEVLDAEKMISQFRFHDQELGIRVRDISDELVVNRTHLMARAAGPERPIEELSRAAELCLEVIEPKNVHSQRWFFQFVVPISGSYDEARKSVMARLFPRLVSAFTPSDFALMMDSTEVLPGFQAQVEFGLIEPEELGARVSRVVGRAGLRGEGASVAFDASGYDFEVALFADVSLHAETEVERVWEQGGLFEQWSERRDQVQEIAWSIVQEGLE